MLLALAALAASPALHQTLHHDAGQSDHHCAITVFSGGRIDLVSLPALVVKPAEFAVVTLLPQTLVLPAPDHQLLPGRGPPVLVA